MSIWTDVEKVLLRILPACDLKFKEVLYTELQTKLHYCAVLKHVDAGVKAVMVFSYLSNKTTYSCGMAVYYNCLKSYGFLTLLKHIVISVS